MGDKSTIEWTDATWNPVTGCSKVSPGCAHCYAESLTRRFAKAWGVPDLPWTPENAGENVILHPERLNQPLRWKRPRMVFVNSMSDLFHELVPMWFVARVFAVMALSPQHTFQVLTKRPERMRELLAWGEWPDNVHAQARSMIADGMLASNDSISRVEAWDGFLNWPLPNVWLGTSIENRRYVHRADLLRETPAAVRFISAEPLLGPLIKGYGWKTERDRWVEPQRMWPDEYDGPELDLIDIDWLIVGGESGLGHRPMNAEWVRYLRDTCLARQDRLEVCSACGHEATHWPHEVTGDPAPCQNCWVEGVTTEREDGPAFFFKQWGGATPKAGGRELDGRTWNEMPVARGAVPA